MARPVIRGIVAVDPRLAIGRGGALPWHYPADLRFFREQTTGHLVLMGRRTFESIGRPLPGRRNIVLSRSGFSYPCVEVIADLDEVKKITAEESRDLYVIGGAQIYQALGPLIEEWVVTRIPVVAEGADTFLPATLFDGFEVFDRRDLGDGLAAEFLRGVG
jgi:dihydrofolate reductase